MLEAGSRRTGLFLTNAISHAIIFSMLSAWLLFSCFIDSMIIQDVSITKYAGRLYLHTRPADGDATTRIISRDEWNSKILKLSDTEELRAALYKDGEQWYFKFKSADGWSSSGTANCSE